MKSLDRVMLFIALAVCVVITYFYARNRSISDPPEHLRVTVTIPRPTVSYGVDKKTDDAIQEQTAALEQSKQKSLAELREELARVKEENARADERLAKANRELEQAKRDLQSMREIKAMLEKEPQ